jgi:hypothetical protein
MPSPSSCGFLLFGLAALAIAAPRPAQRQNIALHAISAETPVHDKVLASDEAGKLVPATLFFHGKRVSAELRNSGGVQFQDGGYLLAAVLDTSGHANGAEDKVLACLITEVPLMVSGQRLEPGVYETGVNDVHRFVVMNIAAHRIVGVKLRLDLTQSRPRPLSILADSARQSYRLYLGRDYMVLSRANR